MRTYEFVVKDHRGKNFKGTLAAEDEHFVHNRLQRHGYMVLSVKEKKVSGQIMLPQRITLSDVAVFTRSFSTVIASGLPVIHALMALEEQTENESLKKIIRTMRMDIEFGADMAATMAKFPHVFSHHYVSMVHSGEMAGTVSKVLTDLADYLDKELDLRAKVRSAFVYPIIVIILALFGLLVIVFVVIPRFQKVYDNLGAELPMVTQAVVSGSVFVRDHWMVMVIGGAAAAFLWSRLTLLPDVRAWLSKVKFASPGIGKIAQRIAHSRFTRTLGSMLGNGVPLLDGIEISNNVVGEPVMSVEVEKIIQSIQAGGTLSEPMRQSDFFPSLVHYLVGAGEKSGNLPEMLIRCADALDREVEYLMRKLLNMLEPMITILLTVAIGFLIFATYAPVYDLMGSMSSR